MPLPNQRPVPPLPPPLPAKKAVVRRAPHVAAAATPKRKRAPIARAHGSRLPIRRELSAGGVVVRQEGTQWLVALLKTEHKRGLVWVLPKGHVELHAKERVSDAAHREVKEEAGLTDLSVKNQLGVTRFKFQAEDAVVHKTVHYFLMVTQQKILTPQLEEGLLEAAWFPIEEAIKALEYDTDQQIVQKALQHLGLSSGRRPVSHSLHTTPRPRRRQLKIHT